MGLNSRGAGREKVYFLLGRGPDRRIRSRGLVYVIDAMHTLALARDSSLSTSLFILDCSLFLSPVSLLISDDYLTLFSLT